MRLHVIACRVFSPELEVLLKDSSDNLSIDYLPLRAHDEPNRLRDDIQNLVDAADNLEGLDAVLLAYGLCGNATAGIRAGRVPLYIPRAHDCSQIFLGGFKNYQTYFGENPSRGWTSRGYLGEDGDPFRIGEIGIYGWKLKELIEQYGEENGRYVWETLHATDSAEDKVLYFLDVPETSENRVLETAREHAQSRNKKLEVIPATLKTLSDLLGGSGGNEILVLNPGETIEPSWDDNVLKAGNARMLENK